MRIIDDIYNNFTSFIFDPIPVLSQMLPILHCVFQRDTNQLTCAAWQWNYVARPPEIIMLRRCKLIPSDSLHSATLMIHTINLGKLTNKLSKLRDKLTELHFFLIEICSLENLAQLKVGRV